MFYINIINFKQQYNLIQIKFSKSANNMKFII